MPQDALSNQGTRPSQLDLARLYTGELQGAEKQQVEAYLLRQPEAAELLDEIEAARDHVPPFDARDIRRRAGTLTEAPAAQEPANKPFNLAWFALPLGLLAASAAALVLVPGLFPPGIPDAPRGDHVGIKGPSDMQLFALHDGALRPYEGEALGEGDVVGFRVHPGLYGGGVVVLSIDGEGTPSVFYPTSGPFAHPIAADTGITPLPGTVVLDDAPGPEVFVGVFGKDVEEAYAWAWAAYEGGGHDGLVRWAEDTPWADAVTVTRQ